MTKLSKWLTTKFDSDYMIKQFSGRKLSNTCDAVRALKLACGATFSLLPHREEDYKLIFSVIPHRWIIWFAFC